MIDPVIQNASAGSHDDPGFSTFFARSSTFRRDRWPSQAEAAASFKKSKFYQEWDPRVLDLFIKYGLRKLPTAIYPKDPDELEETNVTLATNKHQEVLMFLRPNFEGKDAKGNMVLNRQTHPDLDLQTTETYPFYRPEPPIVFNRLPHLRPSALYVFGGKSEISLPHLWKQKLERTGTGVGGSGGIKEGRVKEVVLEDVGHLIPMIDPRGCADATAEFLSGDLQRWRIEEEEWRRKWEAKTKLERMTFDEDWKKNLGGDPRAKSAQKL